MARSTLHTPFAQQHFSTSGSRVSPFQQAAAAALQSLESDDLESGWPSSSHYGPGLRQRYLDVFEPLSSAGRSSSSAGGDDDRRDRGGVDQLRVGRAMTPGPAHLRIVLAEDALHSSQPHIIRARAILTTSSSARDSGLPSTHTLPGLRPTNSLGAAGSGLRAGSSRSSRDSSSSGGSGTPLRRLQRRSSSLLAATSATASNLWSSLSAFGDRSRALLCRSSPVLDGSEGDARSGGSRNGGARHRSASSDSGRHSGVDGVTRSGTGVVALGPVLEVGAGVVVGSPGSSGRVPRLSQRLLLRSTAIRRSAGARSPAVLIDIAATDSYDDLLALDQFNVKRAVKASVLKALPCRTPNLQDEQQQRQCHICFEAWTRPAEQDTGAGSSDAAAWQPVDRSQCCSCRCAHLQQRLQPLFASDSQRQGAAPDAVQLVCWDGPGGLHQVLVPAPAPARLLSDDGRAGGFGSSAQSPTSGSSGGLRDVWASPLSSSSNHDPGHQQQQQQHQPVVRGWTVLTAAQVGASTWQGPSARHVGPSRVEAAAAGSNSSQVQVQQQEPAVPPWASSQAHSFGAGSSGIGGTSRGGASVALAHGCGCGRCRQDSSHWEALQERMRAAAQVQIQQLPCGHEFCSGCIQPWLKEHISCPVCRWTFPESDTRLINK